MSPAAPVETLQPQAAPMSQQQQNPTAALNQGMPAVAPAVQTMPAPAEAMPSQVTPTPQLAPVQTEVPGVASNTASTPGETHARQDSPAQRTLDQLAAKYAAATARPGTSQRTRDNAAGLAGITVVAPESVRNTDIPGDLGRSDVEFLARPGELSGIDFIYAHAPNMDAEQFTVPGIGNTVYVGTRIGSSEGGLESVAGGVCGFDFADFDASIDIASGESVCAITASLIARRSRSDMMLGAIPVEGGVVFVVIIAVNSGFVVFVSIFNFH